MSELIEMMNIGKEKAKKLTAVGIDSWEKLIQTGAKQAFLQLKQDMQNGMEMLVLEIHYITKSDDRLAISKVYEKSWKYAYQGIVPQDYLDGIPEGQWASHIEQADRENLVMVQDGVIIGTSGFGKSRMEEMNGFGEIISLYFLPEFMGKGYGRLLLQAVVSELKKMGFDKVFLWVLEENHNARHFYEKCGFVQAEWQQLSFLLPVKSIPESALILVLLWESVRNAMRFLI